MTVFELIVGLVIGSVVGSFLTCVSWRVPQHMRITGRSVCASCQEPLKNSWNIPVIGWILLNGRSGCCGQKISIRYPLIELLAAAVGAAIALAFGVVILYAVVVVIIAVSTAVSYATSPKDSEPSYNKHM